MAAARRRPRRVGGRVSDRRLRASRHAAPAGPLRAVVPARADRHRPDLRLLFERVRPAGSAARRCEGPHRQPPGAQSRQVARADQAAAARLRLRHRSGRQFTGRGRLPRRRRDRAIAGLGHRKRSRGGRVRRVTARRGDHAHHHRREPAPGKEP